jgi:hypothetical protein
MWQTAGYHKHANITCHFRTLFQRRPCVTAEDAVLRIEWFMDWGPWCHHQLKAFRFSGHQLTRRHRWEQRSTRPTKHNHEVFVVHVDGVRRCLWTATTNEPTAHPPADNWVWTATVEWYWQVKTEELGEKPVPVPTGQPQTPHGLAGTRTRASAVDMRLQTR